MGRRTTRRRTRLTYELRPSTTLARGARATVASTRTLVVLRHARRAPARPGGSDDRRPPARSRPAAQQAAAAGAGAGGLRRTPGGHLQQRPLRRRRVDAVRRRDRAGRCAARPTRSARRTPPRRRRRLVRLVDELLATAGVEAAVLCTHRPVLPGGLRRGRDRRTPSCEPGELRRAAPAQGPGRAPRSDTGAAESNRRACGAVHVIVVSCRLRRRQPGVPVHPLVHRRTTESGHLALPTFTSYVTRRQKTSGDTK